MMGYEVLLRGATAASLPPPPSEGPSTFGQRAAETVAKTVGSWRFIILQSCGVIVWVVANCLFHSTHWDPYPFILMNLVLSLQAAYTAPMILMAQNRQAEHDRIVLYGDYALDASTNQRTRELLQRIDTLEQKIESNEEKLDAIARAVGVEVSLKELLYAPAVHH